MRPVSVHRLEQTVKRDGARAEAVVEPLLGEVVGDQVWMRTWL
jgi:hypothetical protein